MDPYIEACGLWAGFHGHLIEAIYRAIAKVLPREYTIDTGVRAYVVVMGPEGKDESLAVPDLGVTESAPARKPRKKKGGLAVAGAAESVPMQAFIAEDFKERFVEIYAELEERVLVTCIEVLSPSNKRAGTEGWTEYERKRQAMLLGRANFLEIDLLRGGKRFPMLTPWPDSPYALLVSRAFDAPHCRVWLGDFRRPLPSIPVPLLYPEPDLTLEVQPLLDDIYSVGRYEDRIDYNRPLIPPLSEADAAWVHDLLKDQRRRSPRKGRRG
jgi:hypothetical protein